MAATPRTTTNGNGAPAKLPEILTAPSLAEWFAAWVEAHVERDQAEAVEAGNSRLRRAEFAMVKNAASQISDFHAAESAPSS